MKIDSKKNIKERREEDYYSSISKILSSKFIMKVVSNTISNLCLYV